MVLLAGHQRVRQDVLASRHGASCSPCQKKGRLPRRPAFRAPSGAVRLAMPVVARLHLGHGARGARCPASRVADRASPAHSCSSSCGKRERGSLRTGGQRSLRRGSRSARVAGKLLAALKSRLTAGEPSVLTYTSAARRRYRAQHLPPIEADVGLHPVTAHVLSSCGRPYRSLIVPSSVAPEPSSIERDAHHGGALAGCGLCWRLLVLSRRAT